MSKSKYQWLFGLFGILIIAVMLMSAVGPQTALARSADKTTTKDVGTARVAKNFGTSPKLSEIPAVTLNRKSPTGMTVDPANGPVLEARQNLQIPTNRLSKSAHFTPQQPPSFNPSPNSQIVPGDNVAMPSVDYGIEGLNQGANRTIFNYGVYPPDTNGVASRDYYIQTVNMTIGVWDLNKTNYFGTPGVLVYGPAPMSRLWSGTNSDCANADDGDPVVFWDDAAQRFVLTQFLISLNNYGGPYYECMAVSKTANPLDGFYLYQFETSATNMNDYPHFGVWSDGYYMSTNQFYLANSWAGQGVAVFERDKMLAGDPAARIIYIDTALQCLDGTQPECVLGGMLPTDVEGAMPAYGTPNYFMEFDDDAWGYSPDQLQIWQMSTDWAAGSATFTPVTNLPVNSFDSMVCFNYSRNCIPQKDTTVKLDAISDRLMYRLQYRQFSDHNSLVLNHTINATPGVYPGVAGIRWYELRDSGSGFTVAQQGDYAPADGVSRWMGSIAIDKDSNISLGFSTSSATMYPSISYVGRQAGDPTGLMGLGEYAMWNGFGSQTGTGHRWGDYSLMDVGPDGCQFWYTNEYLRGTSAADWYTRIGTFHFGTCDGSPETSITASPALVSHSTSASFSFAGTDNGTVASFECALDGAAFSACTSPKVYTGLGLGKHHFEVRAIDDLGQPDPTPAYFNWSVTYASAKFYSVGSQDGLLRESTPTSNVGGYASTAGNLTVGDDNYNREFRSVLSFNTASLPDNASVRAIALYLKKASITGTNPFTTHGALKVDLRKPYFGLSSALEPNDFEAAASNMNVGTVGASPVGGYNVARLWSGFGNVNLTGLTQLRLHFTMQDTNAVSDTINFFSGDSLLSGNKPALVIYYLLP